MAEEVKPETNLLSNKADEQGMDGKDNNKQGELAKTVETPKQSLDINVESKGNLFSLNQMNNTIPVADTIQQLQTVVNVQDMIDKIADFTKLSVGNQISTMEMQLNPANLGKLFVSISSQNGEITARIAAQTELAKDIIESQISQFKENLSQSGIRVEAVEVTVSTHEFERNLSGNQSMMNQEQQEKKQPKRRMMNGNEFSLNNLQGIMSEEEQVVARMMKESGNTLDYQI